MERNDPERLAFLAEQGKAFHELTSWVDLGMPEADFMGPKAAAMCARFPLLWPAVSAYIEWFRHNVESVLDTERKVAHFEHQFQGRLDLMCRIKGRSGAWILDKKFTAALYPETELQTAGYAVAVESEKKYKKTVFNRATLFMKRVDEENYKPAAKFIPHDGKSDRQQFLCALAHYRWLVSKGIVKTKVRKED